MNLGRLAGWVLLSGLSMALAGPPHAIAPSTVLKRMEERWGQLTRFQADLEQSVQSEGRERERRYWGALYVLRGEMLRLDYQLQPPGGPRAATDVSVWVHSASFSPDHIYLADRDYLVHFDRPSRVVTKQYLSEAALPPIVQALGGTRQLRADEFRDNYYIRPVEEGVVEGQPTYLLRFTPKGQERESLVHYDLWLNAESYLPVRLRVSSVEEIVEIEFRGVRTEEPLPANIFDVRLPPDSQLIDQTLEL
ncbi:MAG TPA: outer membrane lipoprotein carrier protein LolA [Firmicutes bacterium]|nr:outer membrane lipoprotein carrier protein LolA [Bacillota bacterium]